MARSEAPKDRREYIRVSVDMPLNPKLMSLDEAVIPLAGWLAVATLCYCGSNRTDGQFAPAAVYRMAGVGPEIGRQLIEIGMWHEVGHDCPKCPQPEGRKVISHDYLEHQRSKAEIQALQEVRTAAGAKGAEARWSAKRAADAKASAEADAMASATGMANGIASAMANGWQDDGKSMAEVEVEVEVEVENYVTTSVTPDGATSQVSQIPVARNSAKSPPKPKPKQAKDDPLFDADPDASPNEISTQVIVAAYSDAVTRDGGIPTSDALGAIGRNVKRLLEKDKLDPSVVLVAAQRAGSARAMSVSRFLGSAQTAFDRTGQARKAMQAEWYARAAALDAANALQQPQIGA